MILIQAGTRGRRSVTKRDKAGNSNNQKKHKFLP